MEKKEKEELDYRLYQLLASTGHLWMHTIISPLVDICGAENLFSSHLVFRCLLCGFGLLYSHRRAHLLHDMQVKWQYHFTWDKVVLPVCDIGWRSRRRQFIQMDKEYWEKHWLIDIKCLLWVKYDFFGFYTPQKGIISGHKPSRKHLILKWKVHYSFMHESCNVAVDVLCNQSVAK